MLQLQTLRSDQILCSSCDTIKSESAYTHNVWLTMWKQRSFPKAINMNCNEKGMTKSTKTFLCGRCKCFIPSLGFDKKLINACLLENDYETFVCSKCAVDDERLERWQADEYACISCETTVPREQFSASFFQGSPSRKYQQRMRVLQAPAMRIMQTSRDVSLIRKRI